MGRLQSGLHEDFADEESTKGPSERGFGVVVGGVLFAFALWPLVRGRPARVYVGTLGALLIAAALVHPRILVPLNRAWTALGLLLHRVVTPVIMGAIFFSVVTPIGILLRLAGKDLLRLRRDPDARSYWLERYPPGPAPDSMRQQF